MRVIRGYVYDRLIVVDGVAFKIEDLWQAAEIELQNHGSKNVAYDMPPFFYSGSPYADAIKSLAEKHGIQGEAPPPDMDIALISHDGREPAMSSRAWVEVFNLDPSLHWHSRLLAK